MRCGLNMDYSKPTLFVISGPNGAGKSTHIQTMLPTELGNIKSFDRDATRMAHQQELIKQGMASSKIFGQSTMLMEAALLQAMKQAIAAKKHFVLETPLSHPDYWAYIDLFTINNYQIQLNYLCLDKVSDCIARVAQRVVEGGHYVQPATIKGVYDKNLEFINLYSSESMLIELYDGTRIPNLLVRLENNKVKYAHKEALHKTWITTGLTSFKPKIQQFLSEC